MSKVHIISGPAEAPPTPVNKEVIEGQGSVPFGKIIPKKTPNTEEGKIFRGKKRGMGAALRGSRYISC
ncbi:MAG TPA: hypothetical protein DG048_19895 [Pseudoalteromonas sp.]|nr:hypothetical protein [Pseudoalteromonas sp.]|tara:strand:+ start:306 stop:509 length:204 start_codon:yes stop_codon:yes gene_type:complete